MYHGKRGAGNENARNSEPQHAQYSALPVRGGRMGAAFAGVGDFGYGGGLHNAGGVDVGYMHVGPMQPLVPQRIGGGMLADKHAYGSYEEERRRDMEERGWRRSPRRRSSSRSRSPHGRRGGRRRERRGDDESSAEGSDASEIVARVEGVEEELRALVEDRRDQEAQVQEQISQALTLAQRISSGPAVAMRKPHPCSCEIVSALLLPFSCPPAQS